MYDDNIEEHLRSRYGRAWALLSDSYRRAATARAALRVLVLQDSGKYTLAQEYAHLSLDLRAQRDCALRDRWGPGWDLLSEDQRACEQAQWVVTSIMRLPEGTGYDAAQNLLKRMLERRKWEVDNGSE